MYKYVNKILILVTFLLVQVLICGFSTEINQVFALDNIEQSTYTNETEVNIDSYGAIANDPNVDNTIMINNAINDVYTKYGGGTVVVSNLYYFKPYINLKPNVTLKGSGIACLKVMPGSGNYWSCIYVKNSDNVSVLNLNIDQNVNGNTNTNIDLLKTSNPLACIYINQSKNVRIENNILKSCGIWAIIADKGTEDVYVRKNYVDFVQGNSSNKLDVYAKFDNTRIFIDSKGSLVEDNTVVTNDKGAMTAIEIHNYNGVANRNIISGFRTGVILSSSLYDFSVTNLMLKATNNKITNTIAGVTLYGYEDKPDLNNLEINNNDITVNSPYFNFEYGYGINFNLRGSDSNVKGYKNISIHDNKINFTADARTYKYQDAAYNFAGIKCNAFNDISNVDIYNNIIMNASGVGIYVGGRSGGSKWYWCNGVKVYNNTFIDAGKNFNIVGEMRSCIALVGAYKNIYVGPNIIKNNPLLGTKSFIEINQNIGQSSTVKVMMPVEVTSIKLSATRLRVDKGFTGQLKATVLSSWATNKGVTWKSSNTTVATVDTNGKVTGVGAGTATITCTAKDGSGKYATCEVLVMLPKVTSITLNKTSLGLVKGYTSQMTATIFPIQANKSVQWLSSNSAVAKVDASGKVTALRVGSATITCTSLDGSRKYQTCSVTVTLPKVTLITLNKTSLSVKKGYTSYLKETVLPIKDTYKSVTWTSSNTAVATVAANGKVTGAGVGTATITCTAKDGSRKYATCTVTVTK